MPALGQLLSQCDMACPRLVSRRVLRRRRRKFLGELGGLPARILAAQCASGGEWLGSNTRT